MENSLFVFPYIRRPCEGEGNVQDESYDQVLIDNVLIRGAAVWLGDLESKKHIESRLLGRADARGHVDVLKERVKPKKDKQSVVVRHPSDCRIRC